jgi:hypothetical protein
MLGVALAAIAAPAARAQSYWPHRLQPELHAASPGPESRVRLESRFEPFGPEEPPVVERFTIADRLYGALEGRFQIEGGYTFSYDTPGNSHATEHVLPDLLFRYGLTEHFEIRLGWPGLVSTHYDGPLADQSDDDVLAPTIGCMLDLWPQNGWRPQTAVLASVPIDFDGDPLTMDSFQPLSQLLYLWEINDRLLVGGSTGFALFHIDGDHFVELQQTLSLDRLLTDRVIGFMEWEMLVDHGSANDGTQHLLGGGVSFLITDHVQATWRAGIGLNQRAPDFVTGIRFAYRF